MIYNFAWLLTMKFLKKLFKTAVITLSTLFILGAATVFGVYLYLSPDLPSIETLKEVKLQVPLRVYSADKKLISEFGEMKRSPLKFSEIPQPMVNAILSAEDNRYFEHPGVDYQGILRAVVNLALTGKKSQGGSTITMQVARNFFLSSEKTYLRKVNEIFLAFKIENELTKEEILELYLNKIYLGHRSYGIAAAAQVYYGKTIDQLNIAEIAMIAGLPKAPSRFNPITNSQRAVTRRNYVLGRMYALNHIDSGTYKNAKDTPDTAKLHGLSIEVHAPHVAEMVRAQMVKQYGNEQTYTGGYSVITTIDSRLQQAANHALRRALLEYDARHGYRGAVGHIDFTNITGIESWQAIFRNIPSIGYLTPAAVLSLENDAITVLLDDSDTNNITRIPWGGLSWAREYINDNRLGPKLKTASDVVKVGDLIYVQPDPKHGWRLSQPPQAEGALVSVSAHDGHIIALTGGYDFHRSNFNRVTQATRQPGSNFKPFIYSAALEKGFTAASIINDAPVVFDDTGLESAWRPENYSGKFYGPTRLRQALIKSRNLVSIRLMRSIGIPYALEYVSRFGFDVDNLPRDLSLALGSGAVTPLQLSAGYAVLANGGYRVTPHLIKQITDADDNLILEAKPATVCHDDCVIPADEIDALILDESSTDSPPRPVNIAQRVAPQGNIYLMTSMLRDVIRHGTGKRALQLKRNDLAGKTGTTNDQQDAWFSGYNADVATITWVGFDQVRSLGNRETGGRAALPMWIYYMDEALKGTPEKPLERPPGLVTVRIDPENGLLAESNHPGAIFETFRSEYAPTRYSKPKIDQPPMLDDDPSTPTIDAPPPQLF